MIGQAVFRYRALRTDGKVESGRLEAAGREEVSVQLSARGLLPVAIERSEEAQFGPGTMQWSDLALGLRLLADLVGAGLTLDRALNAFADVAPEAWNRVLPQVAELVRQGNTLGHSLRLTPAIPPVVAALVEAGEAGGSSADAISRAAQVAESVAATRRAIRQALTYPFILFAAGLGSLGFLVGIVLPRFAGILAELGQTPPLTTRLVLSLATFTSRMLIPVAISFGIGTLLWRAWTSSSDGLRRWHQFLHRIPVVGQARIALASARASDAIGALLETGVVLPRALEFGAAASGDAAIKHALLRSRDAILQGDSAPRALARERALSPTALRLVRAGDETGRLGSMFSEAGRLDSGNAERLIRNSVQLIEPSFILVFGGLIALVAAALLQALYGVRPV